MVGTVIYYIEYVLPDIDALNTVHLQVPLQVFTEDKKLIAIFGEKRRIPVPYEQIPKQLINAVLATEDQRYFQHAGVDLPGLGRAAVQLMLTGRKLQGGSTITMQVARTFYLTRQKTFGRKIREILLAIKIEHKLKKEKILELYLNKTFLGNRAYGVEAAAEIYYGKHLNELSIDEMAMLAGLPKAPSKLNPLANAKAALKRRDHVLGRMRDEGYIDNATYNQAINEPLKASYHDLRTEVKAPYVAELVRAQLEQMYGDSIYTDGFKAYTTVNSRLQQSANAAVRDNLIAYDQRHGYRGPTDNWGIPSITNMEEWQQKLTKLPIINGLEPAVVVETTPKTITVLRANGDLTILPWDGVSWARKQVSADYLGPRPRSAEKIVRLGDMVRIFAGPTGYSLAQVPKAEGGLVALNPQNGAILSMVGGFDYATSNFNRITHANRQPGSSFKPFVYSAALEKGYTLATIINDAPIVIENPSDNSLWRPQNSNHRFYGPTRLRVALMQSRNVVTIRLLALMGLPYTVNYLAKFGFSTAQLPPSLSLALGTAMVTPLQLSQAYAVFANGGLRIVPFVIDSITNSQDQVIYQAKPLVACTANCGENTAIAPRAISAQNAYLITSTLRDVIQHGTATQAKELGRKDLAGKTGTTQSQVDAWFAGYNPDIVTIAWVGFDQPQSLHEYGARAALPMWMQFMQAALKDKPEHFMEQPSGVVGIRIDPNSGNRASASDANAIFEYFMLPHVPGSEGSYEDMGTITDSQGSMSNQDNNSNQGMATPDTDATADPSNTPNIDTNSPPSDNSNNNDDPVY
jgi:penicillin-binding protein 1A